MLKQIDIDNLMKSIQRGGKQEIYYVANALETREGILDESEFKSNPKYKVIQIRITDIQNAYLEYVEFKNNPNNYHEEQEIEYYDLDTKYIHYYTVKNTSKTFDKSFNANKPSIIYGYRRKIYTPDGIITHIDPSPIKEVYTNRLEMQNKEIKTWDNNLSWKYLRLENPEIVDGIEYNYVTSNWYILKCDNFPRTEDILININQITSYFTTLEDAFNYIDQIK